MTGGGRNRTAVAIRQIGFQDLGVLSEPLLAAGYAWHYCDAFAGDLDGFDPLGPDLVIVLGGPFGVDQGHLYAFVDAELAILRRRLAARRATFGICLGAQLLAHALGAKVGPCGFKEIGWKTIEVTASGLAGPFRHLANTPMLHWHGDTFDLPEGAVRLAGTDICRNQAFAVGHAIVGAQFHLEVDPHKGMATWIDCHAEELQREGIEPESLARSAEAACRSDRGGIPEMFTQWLEALHVE